MNQTKPSNSTADDGPWISFAQVDQNNNILVNPEQWVIFAGPEVN